MDKPPRRCYSEYGASSASKTLSLIPSHVATKIREAQLRQANTHRLLPRNKEDLPSSLPSNTVRNLSGLNFPLRLPKSLPSWRSTQIDAKKQVDGAENFPSIDTVLADPDKNTDKTRNIAETEFYEHMDVDGVVRRRSMMRTVNKDDCLRGRGANPRTGMVTPDIHSVAGSMDSVVEPRPEVKLPSAQWKLKDNQWISEIQDEDKELHQDHTSSQISQANAQPLTSPNLRSFSHGFLEDVPKHRLNSPSTEAVLNVSKIRRKPVGSASKISSNSSEGGTRRSLSEDTVIRTPPVAYSNAGGESLTSFFCPDDVEKVCGVNKSRKHARHRYDRLPFLDLPAKPYQMIEMQGLAKGKKNLLQLERCLRTNDGPYPFPHSIPPANIDQNALHSRAFQPAAPRAYLSNVINQSHLKHPSRPSYPETHQTRSMRQERSIATNLRCLSDYPQTATKKDYQYRNGMVESRRTNMNTSALNSMKQHSHQDADQPHKDLSLLRRDTSREDSHNIPNGHKHLSRVAKKSHGDLGADMNKAKRRPLPGPHKNEMISSSTRPSKWTHTARSDQLSSIGMPIIPAEEDAVENLGTGITRNELSYRTNSSIPNDMDTPPADISGDSENAETGFHDHSTCCPRCCVEHDCHEGCLGHSPQSEVDKSETSSLLSMGVFEASFETSVKAINEVLLTPQEKRGSALAKLRHAFVESLWQGSKSAIREPAKQQPLKRTLRQPSPIRGRPFISDPVMKARSPRQLDVKQAKDAAQKAMNLGTTAVKQHPKGPRPAKIKCSSVGLRSSSAVTESTPNKNAANEGRKVSTAAVGTQVEGIEDCEEEVEEPVEQIIDDIGTKSDIAESVVAKIGALVLHDHVSDPLLTLQPVIMKYGPIVLLKSKEMVLVILDTMTILSCMICDYKRTGVVVLPDGVTFAELVGNCLKTLLYLMVVACLYALLVKVSRIVLCMLRILLLPVKLCAWVIG